MPDIDDIVAMRAEPFGYKAAPVVYYPKYWESQGQEQSEVVMARFTYDHDFSLYLAYPFLFLHEYTAHVYAQDYGNESFNDGWLLLAANVFLKQEWIRRNDQCGLVRDQVNIFTEYLYPKISRHAQIAVRFASDLESWLSLEFIDKFMSLTYELAAFRPNESETEFLPNEFIRALEHEFDVSRERLLSKFASSTTVRDLMSKLVLLT